jgi:hypothetical protein
MKYIKGYKKFLESESGGTSDSGTAYADAGIGGMGSVVSPQPGDLPGKTGTTGSGDIGMVLRKRRGKKGKPHEVSDLRDLEKADVVNVVV